MMVPTEIRSRFRIGDADAAVFLDLFDEPAGSRILEVGAHEEPLANILSECGFAVTGVDLREYDEKMSHRNYDYLRCDFCDLPDEFMGKNIGRFDCAIAISCIEHFGLSTYGEGPLMPLYDVVAMRAIWQLLREGGTAYLTVPFAAHYLEVVPHWRIYSYSALAHRLVQDFNVLLMGFVVADDVEIRGTKKRRGDAITFEDAFTYVGMLPHVSVILKMVKERRYRLAPDGR